MGTAITSQHHDTIVVLDFGSQYTQLIARRMRELGVYTEILPHSIPLSELQLRKPKSVVLSGGPMSVYESDSLNLPADFLEWQESSSIPILGICAVSLNLSGFRGLFFYSIPIELKPRFHYLVFHHYR